MDFRLDGNQVLDLYAGVGIGVVVETRLWLDARGHALERRRAFLQDQKVFQTDVSWRLIGRLDLIAAA